MKCEKCGFDKDRIKILKIELIELNQKVKDAEIEYETGKKLMETVQKMDFSSDENTEVYRRLIKEQLAKQLDALRLRTEMIQKISPESAKILNELLNEYEESSRDFFKMVEKKDKETSGWELLVGLMGFMTAVVGMGNKIDDIVKVCSYSIRDTLQRLES